MLTREQLLAPRAPTVRKVHAFGDVVYIRGLTAKEKGELEVHVARSSNGSGTMLPPPDFRQVLLVRCLCDEAGNRLLTDDDVDQLGNQSAADLTALADVAMELNALSQTDVDELEKNSDSSPPGS